MNTQEIKSAVAEFFNIKPEKLPKHSFRKFQNPRNGKTKVVLCKKCGAHQNSDLPCRDAPYMDLKGWVRASSKRSRSARRTNQRMQ